MKSSPFLLLLLCTAYFSVAQTDKTVKTSVQKAIVYQQGAQLFSTETVSLPAGTTEITFENVSPYLNTASLQASSKGEAVVIDVRYNVKYSEPEKVVDKSIPETTMKRYERELQAVQDSLKEIEFLNNDATNQQNRINSERNIIAGNRMMQGNLQKDSLRLFMSSLEFWRTRISTLDAELGRIVRESYRNSVLTNQLLARNSYIRTLMAGTRQVVASKSPTSTPQIIVTMMAETAMLAEISVSYFVNQASWVPSYDLRASKENSNIELKHRASVTQNTGLDWKNVNLVLSTGNPNQTSEKPTLNPFFLTYEQAILTGRIGYDYGGKDGKLKNSNVQQREVVISAPNMPAPVMLPNEEKKRFEENADKADKDLNDFVNVQDNLLRVEYNIALKCNIESDSRPRNVVIQSKSIPTTYTYSVVPKLDPDVFLMARITDWENMNLVAGAARVYFDNSYIGESYINPRNTNDTLQLNFGRDKSIVVNRTKVKDKCREKLFNDHKFSAKTYEITIRNTKNAPIRLIVEDQMPVTKEPDIKIEYTENSNATKFNAETGKLTWDLTVKPKDNKKLTFSYEVKHAKDKVVNNL
jgi:uncharacterized protein (TIGR02231 family)